MQIKVGEKNNVNIYADLTSHSPYSSARIFPIYSAHFRWSGLEHRSLFWISHPRNSKKRNNLYDNSVYANMWFRLIIFLGNYRRDNRTLDYEKSWISMYNLTWMNILKSDSYIFDILPLQNTNFLSKWRYNKGVFITKKDFWNMEAIPISFLGKQGT